jgi:hypothetical protein
MAEMNPILASLIETHPDEEVMVDPLLNCIVVGEKGKVPALVKTITHTDCVHPKEDMDVYVDKDGSMGSGNRGNFIALGFGESTYIIYNSSCHVSVRAHSTKKRKTIQQEHRKRPIYDVPETA